ncbi:hypothetical protein [Nostoc sp. FACHB-133]|uniref:hypothetical protein n=1 Tax=Nostoc sp. FACHB-133 TaxID=2692835 RepID=UPI001688B59A|nr:hypothetical protein [Nostoc sp. FACHB-133]MBD2526742.1 hypothetical protein [Nostoc sp. FACHB-133]
MIKTIARLNSNLNLLKRRNRNHEDDEIYGGSGKDRIYAGTGADLVEGNKGNDRLETTRSPNDNAATRPSYPCLIVCPKLHSLLV